MLNELLGIRYPIIQGAMANIADGKFAAAVSNAGALGIIATGSMKPEQVKSEIEICKSLTTKPFGVNVMLMNPFCDEIIEIINVKIDPSIKEELIKNNDIYEAYHMNKKSWISLKLDDTLSDELIKDLIKLLVYI